MRSTVLLLAFGWAVALAAAQTPAERKIAAARRLISAAPAQYQHYNTLAMALAQRARETADPGFYAQAEKALEESLRIAPENYEGLKARAWILLGKHEFAAALTLAQKLNRRMPDDVLVYGMLADAHAELGNYDEAEKAVQWMLDLRPGNVAALTRGAYLRELFGDLDGAVDFLQAAFQRIRPDETEQRAWVLVQLAHVHRLAGRHDLAQHLAERALGFFPGYHYALAELARVRAVQGRHSEAVALLKERFKTAPHPECRYELALALDRAGETREAKKHLEQFEQEARHESDSWDNANRELVFYYADYAGNPEEALRVAERELARRKDIYTRHAYAWALFRSGRVADAVREMEAVLAVGIRDPLILEHAEAMRRARVALPQ